MIQPTKEWLLIKPIVKDEVTDYGMYLPDSGKVELDRGEVAETSNTETYPKGTIVIFNKFSINPVKDGDQLYLLVREREIMATIVNERKDVVVEVPMDTLNPTQSE